MSLHLSDPLSLLHPLERASAAVGRLAQTAAATPVWAAWLHRSRAEASAAIADVQCRFLLKFFIENFQRQTALIA